MKVKHILILLVFLSTIILGACKKGVSTGPGGDLFIELSGRITLNGQGFANVTVYLSQDVSKKTKTGADGKFSFTNLSTGSYIITPSKKFYAFSPMSYEVKNQSGTELNFKAENATYGSGVGNIAANFTAKDQNNKSVSLYNYFGKVILFDFTADWCTECKEKAQTAEQFYQKYKDKGFMYILIVIDGDPKEWANKYGLTFPVLDDNSKKIYNKYALGNIPLPHVLDRNCNIRYKKQGWNKSEVEAVIEKFL